MKSLSKTIFNRAYQSYLMGGDTYTYFYKNSKNEDREKADEAVAELEEMGLVEVIFKGERKIKMTVTEDGINYGNNMFL